MNKEKRKKTQSKKEKERKKILEDKRQKTKILYFHVISIFLLHQETVTQKLFQMATQRYTLIRLQFSCGNFFYSLAMRVVYTASYRRYVTSLELYHSTDRAVDSAYQLQCSFPYFNHLSARVQCPQQHTVQDHTNTRNARSNAEFD